MKKLFLLLILSYCMLNTYSQEKISKDVYVYKDTDFEGIHLGTIIIINNDTELIFEYEKILEKFGFSTIKYQCRLVSKSS